MKKLTTKQNRALSKVIDQQHQADIKNAHRTIFKDDIFKSVK